MKKISILILTSFISALLFNVSIAFAGEDDEKKKLKVYYSEPIGAGDKVYRVTSCRKAQSYAPLKCIAESDTKAYFEPDQCVKGGKALDGEYVQGCLVPNTYEEVGEQDESKAGLARYPKVDKTKFKLKYPDGCSDKPDQQGFEYVPEWAIVDKSPPTGITPAPSGDDAKKYWTIRGSVAWQGNPPPAFIEAKFGKGKDGSALEAEPLYRPALCVSYDVFAEDSKFSDATKGKAEAQGELKERVKKLFDDVSKEPMDDSKCNTDNSKTAISDNIPVSTPFDQNKTFSCSIQERITGSSGSEVLANYIGAIYRWAAGIVGIVAVLIMVASGIQMSAAGGDSAKLDEAKNRILKSIIGLAILFLSGLILYTINPTFFTGG